MADPIQLSSREAFIYVVVINAVIGFVLGLIPLLLGYFYKQLRMGIIGILTATIGGSVLGIFASIPATIIFTWLIFSRSKIKSIENKDPIDVSTDDPNNTPSNE